MCIFIKQQLPYPLPDVMQYSYFSMSRYSIDRHRANLSLASRIRTKKKYRARSEEIVAINTVRSLKARDPRRIAFRQTTVPPPINFVDIAFPPHFSLIFVSSFAISFFLFFLFCLRLLPPLLKHYSIPCVLTFEVRDHGEEIATQHKLVADVILHEQRRRIRTHYQVNDREYAGQRSAVPISRGARAAA